MSNSTALPLARQNRSLFLEHASNAGRAYRNQALELISMCQILSQIASPKCVHEEAEQRSILRVCDIALRSAADSGTKVTEDAKARFEEATQVLNSYSERRHRLDLPTTFYSRMEIAKRKDSVEGVWPHVAKRGTQKSTSKDESGPTMIINFVLLRSPLLSPHDPGNVTVSQELSTDPSFPEILWNFIRYKDRARISLEQNPHFYLRCPAEESVYTPTFQRYPLQNPSGALEHNDTVYVLFDGPGRVFLDTEHKLRIFGNIWLLNGSLIFRDRSGVLEGEQLVRGSNHIRGNLWYCEQQMLFHNSKFRSRLVHRYLRPIVTTPSADCSSGGIFEDWTALNRLASRSINIHIYNSSSQGPGSINSPDVAPPPPTSERPGYHVLYTTINTLNDDILLCIFDYFRLDPENSWNDRIGWRKLFHVCHSWRHLIYQSAFRLGMHILCTNGTPGANTLDHLPPLPLIVDYRYLDATMIGQDELGIYNALRMRDRVRHIVLHLPPLILHKCLVLMNEYFPTLEHLFLSFTVDKITTLTLPKAFLAPNLRHLVLQGIGLPKRLRLLSTVSLIILELTNFGASAYFLPRLLVARLQSHPQLEELSIGFSHPKPRPSAERQMLSRQGTPATFPSLKTLRFRGTGAYLDCFVAQIRAPHLERLDITLFNQIAFALPHLSHFTGITEGFKLHTANVFFGRDKVSVTTAPHSTLTSDRPFILRVICKQLDWQIDCAAQICSALIPTLSGVERLALDFYGTKMPTEWEDGEIDSTTWNELLRPFIGVKELHICSGLLEELSRALQDEVGLDPEFLPDLRELVGGVNIINARRVDTIFNSFIDTRRVTGRPVQFRPSPTLLVDGYISQTFQRRTAEQYFLNLLKSTSIPPDATLPYIERGEYFFFVHSVPFHIPAVPPPNPPYRWLLDRSIIHKGTVVPQTMWAPRSVVDKRRHPEEAELQMPIFFVDEDGRLGLSLGASTDGQRHVLRDASDPAPLGQKTTTHIRIVWPGYKMFKRQIQIRDESTARNPITMASFLGQVRRTVDTFLEVCELDSESVDDRHKLWRIGPSDIQRSDIIIIGAVHVAAASWMPIMQLNRHIY